VSDELHWATLWEAIADAIPDEEAIVHGDRRTTWRAMDDRASRLAGAMLAAGLQPRAKVAQYLYNSAEYVESWFATLKIRGVPVNVNYRYVAEELRYLLENSDAEALIFHTSLADRVAEVLPTVPGVKLAVAVDDSGDVSVTKTVDRTQPYEDVIAAASPAPRIERSVDDRVMTYTGGTTGMPKGVMGRIGRGVAGLFAAVPPLVGPSVATSIDDAVRLARLLRANDTPIRSLPACPLMHGTGMVIGMQTGLLLGGTVVLLDNNRHFDAVELWDIVERERVTLVAVVGDPFARPMLQALDQARVDGRTWDLTGLRFISSSGAMFSHEVRAGLVDHLPAVTIFDYISSTEGLMGTAVSRAGDVAPTGRFRPVPGVKVFTEDDRPVAPGSGERGIVGLTVGVPDGYYKDAAKSARTFREVDGVRYSFPGDWAMVEADGSISLLGRGSQCINTGGEKVFPEEVEEALKRHPAVDDCLVVGLPDERFGQRVAAVVSRASQSGAGAAGADVTPDDVLGASRSALAGYKVPRHLLFVDRVPRSPSGKADYPAARQLLLDQIAEGVAQP
jgi:acyl-CoA synthetase (AMP-forming)/AMP-acid ligase II